MTNHGLDSNQLNIIRSILSPYAEYIDLAGLFGSRATGSYRPNSDIDMVLYGQIDEETTDRIWTIFDESLLPVKVDINTYDLIKYPPLKAHIDSVMEPLFTKEDLMEKPHNN